MLFPALLVVSNASHRLAGVDGEKWRAMLLIHPTKTQNQGRS